MAISQSDKIFGAILIAFVIYITVRGQLPAYFQIFTPASAASSSSSGSPSSGSPGAFLGNIGNTISNLPQSIWNGIFGQGATTGTTNILNGIKGFFTGAGNTAGDILGGMGG